MNTPAVRKGFQTIRASMIDLLGSCFEDASIAISMFNPISREHESVGASGYDQSMLDFLNGTFINYDEDMVFLRSSNLTCLEWNSTARPYRDTLFAKEYFIPKGYHGGITQLLFSEERQYTGALHINIKTTDSVSREAQRLISNSAPILASVTDWWHEIVSLECEATPESFLFVVINKKVFCNREDPVRVLGVRTVEKILRADSESRIPHQFYIEDCHGKRWSMKAMRKNGELLLFAHPGVLPFSITPRELDIASWLVGGLQTKEIAQALQISERTVAHHVESLLLKLGLHNRVSAAIFCYRNGILTLR